MYSSPAGKYLESRVNILRHPIGALSVPRRQVNYDWLITSNSPSLRGERIAMHGFLCATSMETRSVGIAVMCGNCRRLRFVYEWTVGVLRLLNKQLWEMSVNNGGDCIYANSFYKRRRIENSLVTVNERARYVIGHWRAHASCIFNRFLVSKVKVYRQSVKNPNCILQAPF